MFEALALPSTAFLARNHPAFQHLIIVSATMPLRWRYRLWRLTRNLPWCRVLSVRSRINMRSPIQTAVARFAGGRRVFSFRLDDDDALGEAYLGSLMATLNTIPDDNAVSFDDGLYIARVDDDHFSIAESSRSLIAAGLGVVSRGPRPTTIHNLGRHTKIDQKAPVASVRNDRPLWLRVIHPGNDSPHPFPKNAVIVSTEDCVGRLRDGFCHLDLYRAIRSLAVLPK